MSQKGAQIAWRGRGYKFGNVQKNNDFLENVPYAKLNFIYQNYPRNTVRGRICLGLRLDWDVDRKKETSDIYIKPRWWRSCLLTSFITQKHTKVIVSIAQADNNCIDPGLDDISLLSYWKVIVLKWNICDIEGGRVVSKLLRWIGSFCQFTKR